MNWMVVVENAASVAFVLVCWTLAHQNSGGREPFARTISAGYGMAGLFALGSVLFRAVPDLSELVPISVLAGRIALVITLSAVAARLGRIYPKSD